MRRRRRRRHGRSLSNTLYLDKYAYLEKKEKKKKGDRSLDQSEIFIP